MSSNYNVDLQIFKGLPFWIGVGSLAGAALISWLMKNRARGRILKNPNIHYALKLVEKVTLSHDTRLFRFELPFKDHVLGLPVGQHIYLSAHINNDLVIRPYTPVSTEDDAVGYIDLVVKVYFRDVHPNYPDGGKMSQYLNDLSLGQLIDCRGPSGRLIYHGKGEFSIRPDKKSPPQILQVKRVNMIAGGSGVTPMLQIIKAVLKDRQDRTCLSLVFANQTEDDILCRSDLETAAKTYPNRFKLWYTLDRPPAEWNYSIGFINSETLGDHFYSPDSDTLVLMCGPPAMIKYACTPSLNSLGYPENLRFIY